MNKFSTSALAVLFGLAMMTGVNAADADKQAIQAECTAEAKGAVDVNEYIEECVKERMEELKEAAGEADKEKG